MQKFIKIIIAISIVTFIFGCAPNRSTRVYTAGQALQAEDVEEGVVESVEEAVIRKEDTPVGALGGAALGGIAASTIGGGKGKELASIGGALLGGLAGHFIEQKVTDQQAFKIVVRLNSGQKIVVVQESDVAFQPGERVNVFSSRVDNTKRVSKM
jgi:outer membrane lipoprotein SlyB